MSNLMNTNKTAIISTDASTTYAFYMPIVSRMWQNIGYDVCPIFIGNEAVWKASPKLACILNAMSFVDVPTHWIEVSSKLKSSTMAQVARVFAYLFRDDVYLLVSDADMFPLSKEFFHQQDMTKALHIIYANAYQYQKFPMCYLGAHASVWRSILNNPHTCPQTAILHATSLELPENASGDTQWNFDESFISNKIMAWPGYPSQCQMVERDGGPPKGRLDRCVMNDPIWKFDGNMNGLIDCHSIRPAYTSENFNKLLPLFSAFMPQSDVAWITQYVQDFNDA